MTPQLTLQRPLIFALLCGALIACGGNEPGREGPLPEDDPPPTSDAGTEDVQLPDEEVCEAPCEPEEGCQGDEACAEGEICEVGACVEGCRFDGACEQGEICEGFVCAEGCRNPADCPIGHTCRELACVQTECAFDSDCGAGARCREATCLEIGDAPCSEDDECGYRWRCTSQGRCHDSICATHEDCAETQWCRSGICIERHTTYGALAFERRLPEHIRDHITDEDKTYGVGGGLFDLDGDLDLDLFLGGANQDTDSPPCVYRNISEPGEIAFEPVEGLCGFELGRILSAGGVDVDNDGRDELLLLGEEQQFLLRFHPERVTINLRDAIETNDPRRLCKAGAYAATDVDFDGLIDLLIGCQPRKQPRRREQHNIALRQREDGTFEPFDTTFYEALKDDGATLALGVIDVDEDGLLDVVLANDTFVKAGTRTNHLTTGGLLFRCAPDRGCTYDRHPFAEGTPAWGSFMGVGNIRVEGSGDHLYVTDWGPNRLLHYDALRNPIERADEFDVAVASSLSVMLFAWSAIVEDLDRNGLDDLIITQGSASPDTLIGYVNHQDVALLQRDEGDFDMRGTSVGFVPPSHEDSLNEERVYSSRGAVKADLDQDGYLDIIIASLEGVTKLYAELPGPDNAPDRCTLVPRNRVVPSYGLGYAVSPAWKRDFRRRDMQGHLRFGASPWVLTSVGRGVLRFPSGAEASFDCEGTPGPLVIEEPDWIEVQREGDQAVLSLEMPWIEGEALIEVALRRPDNRPARIAPVVDEGEGRWSVGLEEGEDAVMLRVQGRWVARWWTL